MKTYPLQSISIEEAMERQFRLVDSITRHFTGLESLSRGDLGVVQPGNQPLMTRQAEQALADFFNTEDCILVRGSGTGAIRYGLAGMLPAGSKILIHTSPIYSTTKTTFDMFGYELVEADFNEAGSIEAAFQANPDIAGALVQYSRQLPSDSYNMEEVISRIKACKDVSILTDDNYAAMKVAKTGAELGADLSCFSTFKLLGPEGIGCIIGKKKWIDAIRRMHYSGGCQVQGFEAQEVLRGLTFAPVLLAVSSKQAEELERRLRGGELEEVEDAFIANAQSKVLLVVLKDPIAQEVIAEAQKRGALPHPVGSESKYEIPPLFYKASGTMLAENPAYRQTMIRINPNRSSADTVIRILKESINAVKNA